MDMPAAQGAVNLIAPMYSSTFIFAKAQFDDAFHRLDEAIAVAARSIPGYLGEESWEDAARGLSSNVYTGIRSKRYRH